MRRVEERGAPSPSSVRPSELQRARGGALLSAGEGKPVASTRLALALLSHASLSTVCRRVGAQDGDCDGAACAVLLPLAPQAWAIAAEQCRAHLPAGAPIPAQSPQPASSEGGDSRNSYPSVVHHLMRASCVASPWLSLSAGRSRASGSRCPSSAPATSCKASPPSSLPSLSAYQPSPNHGRCAAWPASAERSGRQTALQAGVRAHDPERQR